MRYEELKHNPELQPSPVHATIVLTPNFNVKPLADKRVRQALSLAISRERMLNILPHVRVADALVPRKCDIIRSQEKCCKRMSWKQGGLWLKRDTRKGYTSLNLH